MKITTIYLTPTPSVVTFNTRACKRNLGTLASRGSWTDFSYQEHSIQRAGKKLQDFLEPDTRALGDFLISLIKYIFLGYATNNSHASMSSDHDLPKLWLPKLNPFFYMNMSCTNAFLFRGRKTSNFGHLFLVFLVSSLWWRFETLNIILRNFIPSDIGCIEHTHIFIYVIHI